MEPVPCARCEDRPALPRYDVCSHCLRTSIHHSGGLGIVLA